MSTSAKTQNSNEPDPERFYANLAPDFRFSWGHNFFVSKTPFLQHPVDGEGFVKHQSAIAPSLATWWIEPTKTCVDVEQRSAVLRGNFYMVAKGQSEPVVNDIIFWVEMDEEGKKVVKAMEFIDPTASAELGERIKASKSE